MGDRHIAAAREWLMAGPDPMRESDVARLATLLKATEDAERERCASLVREWINRDTMQLRAGEMTMAERRSVTAVLYGIISAIRKGTE